MTAEQINFIVEHYGKSPTNAIAAHLNVSTATVLRWAKRLGLDIRSAYKKTILTEHQRAFIMENYGQIPSKLIAKALDLSVAVVRSNAKLLGCRVTREQLQELKTYYCTTEENPNPVTNTTKMLICRYYYEGDSIQKIAFFLGRPVDVVSRILNECINNGLYRQFNLFPHLKGAERNACPKGHRVERSTCERGDVRRAVDDGKCEQERPKGVKPLPTL